MILYLNENILRVARVLDLAAVQFCPASTEEMASVEMSEANVKALYAAGLAFVIELERNDQPPVFVSLKPHRLNATMGIAWFIPQYFKYPKPLYDVEFKQPGASDQRMYLTGVSSKRLDELSTSSKILRVYSIHGLTEKFLDKFNMKLVVKGKFSYATPKKQT